MSLKNAALIFGFLMLALTACKDPWADYNEVKDPVLAGNLMQLIDKHPELTRFRELLIKTGMDKELSSSKTYTVWAPSNEKLDEMLKQAGAEASDSTLVRFVGYHIARQTYFTRNTADSTMRILTMNGKAVEFTRTGVEDASIVAPDQYTGNGVLHVINHPLIARKNNWEVFEGLEQDATVSQKNFISSWKSEEFDPENSKQIGVNEQGKPIYDSAFVTRNGFLKNVADISNEGRLYTFFVLADDAYTQERDKLKNFFADSTELAASFRTQAYIVKDLVVKGRYDADHLPAFFYSPDSTRFSVSKSSIVRSIPTSNGIVHIISSVSYQMSDKVKPVFVQGESVNEISPSSLSLNRRTRKAPDGTIFRDIMNNTHTVNGVWLRYSGTVFSGRYRVYWRMVRDFSLVPASGATDIVHFPQKVTWNERWKTPAGTVFDPLASNGFGYRNEPFIANADGTFSPDYNEVLLGEMTVDRYGVIDLYLVANRTATAVQNAILLDYLKLEPVY